MAEEEEEPMPEEEIAEEEEEIFEEEEERRRREVGQEVELRIGTLVPIYPRPGEAFYSLPIVYTAEGMPPRRIELPLTEHFPGKEEEAREQIAKGEGPLYEEFLPHLRKAIREDLERRKAVKVTRVRI